MDISCGLLITRKNKILLGHVTGKKFWDIPKGMKEENEDYITCCLREVKEETGLDFRSKKSEIKEIGLCKYSTSKDLYLFQYDLKSFRNIESLKCTTYFDFAGKEFSEIDDFKYVDFEDICEYTNYNLGFILCKLLNVDLSLGQREKIRSTMCYILRHNLKTFIDGKASPWMNIEDVYNECILSNPILSIFDVNDFLTVINKDTEKRFTIKGDQVKVNYGHTVDLIEETMNKVVPPLCMYHNTFECFIDDIEKEGLKPSSRKYVYLATTKEKAMSYDKKRNSSKWKMENGKSQSVLLEIDSAQAYRDGIEFFEITENILVVKYMPTKYIKRLDIGVLGQQEFLDIFNKLSKTT